MKASLYTLHCDMSLSIRDFFFILIRVYTLIAVHVCQADVLSWHLIYVNIMSWQSVFNVPQFFIE